MEERKEHIKKNKVVRMVFPIIHILLSFFTEWFVLIPRDRARVAFSLPLNNLFSDAFEQVMVYIIAKIMAAVIIFLLWYVVFAVFDRKKVALETTIVFTVILLVSSFITLLMWPDVFEAGGDNFIPYSYAVRLMPEYWHSVYLTCLYTASVMVIPHTASINFLQTVFFVLAVGYLYNRIRMSEVIVKTKWARFLILPVFLLRDTFTVMTNPERAEYNVAFTLFFLSIIVMDIVEKKKRPVYQLVFLLIFSAFLAVFRSEGIIVGILSFAALVILVYRPKLLKMVLLFGCLFLALIVFKIPGKVGDIKYYGSDYSIINSFNSLHNIFLNDKANLTYGGASEDLAAIEAITPVELIKEYASDGYRRYNYSKGYADINQSRAGKEVSAAYKKAYKSIVLHNLPIYARTQAFMFLQATCVVTEPYIEEYHGESNDFPVYGVELWQVGRDDFQVIPGRYKWERFSLRNKLAAAYTIPRLKMYDVVTKTRLYTVFLALEFVIGLFIPVYSFLDLIKFAKSNNKNDRAKKQKANSYIATIDGILPQIGVGIIALILDMYVIALSLVMPVGANMYFHAFIYCIYTVILVWLGVCLKKPSKD